MIPLLIKIREHYILCLFKLILIVWLWLNLIDKLLLIFIYRWRASKRVHRLNLNLSSLALNFVQFILFPNIQHNCGLVKVNT